MPMFRVKNVFAFAFLLVAMGLPQAAKADTYTIEQLAITGEGLFNVGLTDNDVLVTQDLRFPAHGGYDTFTLPSTIPTKSDSIPSVTFDSGSACNPTEAGGFYGAGRFGVCNNGHEAFQGSAPNGDPEYGDGLYVGPNTSDLLFQGDVYNILMNSFGDVAFVYADRNDNAVNYIAIDETTHAAAAVTPEPSSMVLLGTGLLALFVVAKRRQLFVTAKAAAHDPLS